MAQLARSGDEVRPVPRAAVSFASMLFPAHHRSAFEWAMPLASRAAVARLASTSTRTLRGDDSLHFPLPTLSDELEDVRLCMAAERCQVADAGHPTVRFSGVWLAAWPAPLGASSVTVRRLCRTGGMGSFAARGVPWQAAERYGANRWSG